MRQSGCVVERQASQRVLDDHELLIKTVCIQSEGNKCVNGSGQAPGL